MSLLIALTCIFSLLAFTRASRSSSNWLRSAISAACAADLDVENVWDSQHGASNS
jgi:hypothetical protein